MGSGRDGNVPSHRAQFAELYRLWGELRFTVEKRNKSFRTKDKDGKEVSFDIPPGEYSLSQLLVTVGQTYTQLVSGARAGYDVRPCTL
jgi:hypothetical protein